MPIRTARPALLLLAAVLGGCGLSNAPLRGRTAPEAAAPHPSEEPVSAAPRPSEGPASAAPRPSEEPASATARRGLRVSLGGGAAAEAELLQEQRERRLWRAGERLAFATDGPRVTATAGPPQMIMATRIDGPDPLGGVEALLEREAPTRRLVDLGTPSRDPAEMRFGVDITCRLRATPLAANAGPPLLLVEERCRASGGIAGFTNRFWVRHGDGAVVRSEQRIGPGVPMLVLEAVGS
ncbi:MAG: YjbF family lipoprotein [Acetobacteraceae bacterium]|nr:YjbF family lipoprotein [Acetobacteraceae bacterium]